MHSSLRNWKFLDELIYLLAISAWRLAIKRFNGRDMPKTWMVRAGRDAIFIDDFRDNSLVSIGWNDLGSLGQYPSKDELARGVAAKWPDWHKQAQSMSVGQVWRFKSEIEIGDTVVTYDPSRRLYLVGTVSGPYKYDAKALDQPNIRPVSWDG
jgi:restriction system protein